MHTTNDNSRQKHLLLTFSSLFLQPVIFVVASLVIGISSGGRCLVSTDITESVVLCGIFAAVGDNNYSLFWEADQFFSILCAIDN
jgi:hypothetical protein